ncbi:uncharacterized protein DS421_4g118690 [Arachis hypogaea]|nr:uncharacterized protein DS421_4g118690 [Arachis hypogaea]
MCIWKVKRWCQNQRRKGRRGLTGREKKGTEAAAQSAPPLPSSRRAANVTSPCFRHSPTRFACAITRAHRRPAVGASLWSSRSRCRVLIAVVLCCHEVAVDVRRRPRRGARHRFCSWWSALIGSAAAGRRRVWEIEPGREAAAEGNLFCRCRRDEHNRRAWSPLPLEPPPELLATSAVAGKVAVDPPGLLAAAGAVAGAGLKCSCFVLLFR